MAQLIPPAPLAHVAPLPNGDALGLVIIDASHPDARGGSIRCSEETLRLLPALIAEAIARYDRQRGDRAA